MDITDKASLQLNFKNKLFYILFLISSKTSTIQPSTCSINNSSEFSTQHNPPHVYSNIIYDNIITNNTGSHTNIETLSKYLCGRFEPVES